MRIRLRNFHYIIDYMDVVFSHGFYSAHAHRIRKHDTPIYLAHIQEPS
jgi:hypothetical protein